MTFAGKSSSLKVEGAEWFQLLTTAGTQNLNRPLEQNQYSSEDNRIQSFYNISSRRYNRS